MTKHMGAWSDVGNAAHIKDRRLGPYDYCPNNLPVLYDDLLANTSRVRFHVFRVRAMWNYYQRRDNQCAQ